MCCVLNSFGEGGYSALFSRVDPANPLPSEYPIESTRTIRTHCSDRITSIAAFRTNRPSRALPSVESSDPLGGLPMKSRSISRGFRNPLRSHINLIVSSGAVRSKRFVRIVPKGTFQMKRPYSKHSSLELLFTPVRRMHFER